MHCANVGPVRDLFELIRPVPFDPYAFEDLVDRISALTVVAGLRRVAAFGFAELDNYQALERMRATFGRAGLQTKITREIRPIRYGVRGPVEVVNAFETRKDLSYKKRSGHLLWIGVDLPKDSILAVVHAKSSSGILLAYPPCCVGQEQQHCLELDQAFIDSLLVHCSGDVSRAIRLIRDGENIELPDWAFDSNFPATMAKFPFVAHVACDTCLTGADSPSARLNTVLSELAEAVSPTLKTAVERLGPEMQKREKLRSDAKTSNVDPREYPPLKDYESGISLVGNRAS